MTTKVSVVNEHSTSLMGGIWTFFYSLLVRVADKCDGVFIAPHNEGGGRGGCAIVDSIGWS